jgi:hypothetical protein
MVMAIFMIAINLRFFLFAYSFIICDYGQKYKTFLSDPVKYPNDPMQTSVSHETVEMYRWRGWIGLLNMIILFFMFFNILKMHAFQAGVFY